MSRLLMRLFVAILGLLALYFLLSRLGIIPTIGGVHKIVADDQRHFAFKISHNEFGDRVLLQTRARVTYTPQSTAPDLIEVLPKKGTYEGNFTWTLIPDQGGERRLLGEYFTGGRTYKVCEYLHRAKGGEAERAERYAPVNNDGIRFRIPEQIDPVRLKALYDAMLADVPRLDKEPKGSTDPVDTSPELRNLASDTVFFCLGNPVPSTR